MILPEENIVISQINFINIKMTMKSSTMSSISTIKHMYFSLTINRVNLYAPVQFQIKLDF